MRIRLLLGSIPLLAAAASAASAQGWIIPRPCVRPLPNNERIAPCPPTSPTIVRTRSDVRARLDDRVLRYEVEERFVNRGVGLGEADYVFPLPKGAAFQDLKLEINGELVAGETMNANDARRIYEDIVRRQRDPALVEYMGHGLLRARIFPINPGEEKRVVIRFDAVAEREGDALRVDYFRGTNPGAAATRDVSTREDRSRSSFVLTYTMTASLGTPYSPTHALDIDSEGRTRRVDVRGDARDVTILFPLRRGDQPAISALTHAPGGQDGFALVTLAPPIARERETTARDVTFVLDVSGSMSGRKMEQARAAGKQLLQTLRPQDRFRIVDFATDVRSFRDDFVFATASNVRSAERYLSALEAQGSTNISGALTEALRAAPDEDGDERRLSLVLFVTDGEATVGERRPEAIAEIAARGRRDRRIFTFGLGSDVNVALLERMALEGRGTAQFVRPDESVERMVGVVASRLVDPVLTDVRVRAEGDVRLSKVLPQQPLDLFAGQDLVLLARYSGDGVARLVFEGRSRGEPVRWTSTVEFPARDRDNAFVARLWATQRVGYLAAEKRRNGGSRELDDEIRSLGERYGIPTEFTSYLVLEPGMNVAAGVGNQSRMRDAVGRAAGAPLPTAAAAPPPASAEARFEKAREAAQQRSARTLADVDAMDMTGTLGTGSMVRRVDGRTFQLKGDRWTDIRYTDVMKTVALKPYSREYFEIMEKLPELKAVFALGDKVTVVGRALAIRLDETATTPDMDLLLKQF